MKNFRKVLALVLVVATLFSFAAMASAASFADYKDNADVNYDEAVSVVSLVGIMNGIETGDDLNFEPNKTLTRAETAAIIARLANAGYDVDDLYADACTFADVDKDNWAASYIAYCASTDIVAGIGNNCFNPDGKVTGLQLAKMLLVVLGFDAEKQGYVNNGNWHVNVLADAKLMGLLNGYAADFDVKDVLTREEAAQMMFNALKAPAVVGYASKNVVDVTNALVFSGLKNQTVNGTWPKVSTYATLVDALKLGNWALYNNVVISDDILGYVLFGLELVAGGSADCYGRPGISWQWKNAKGTVTTLGSYTDKLAYEAKIAVDLDTVLKEEAALTGATAYKMDVFVDGASWYSDAALSAVNFAAIEAYTGNGVKTEIYVDDVTKEVTIVIINTYLAVVTQVSKASNTFSVVHTTNQPDAWVTPDNAVTLCFSNKGYGFEEGDVVWYWLCNGTGTAPFMGGKLHNATLATAKEMSLSNVKYGNPVATQDTATLDGTAYEYAMILELASTKMSQLEVSLAKNEGATFDVYMDEYGFIKAWDRHAVAQDTGYAYILEGTGTYSNNGWQQGGYYYSYKATKDYVGFDGKLVEDAPVTETLFTAMNQKEYRHEQVGRLVKYTMVDGLMDVLDWSKGADMAYRAGVNDFIDADGDITYNGTVLDATEKTKFLVRTWNFDTETYDYNVYNENNLPASYWGLKMYGNVAANGDMTFGATANIQWFVDAKTNALTYVFVDAVFAKVGVTAFVTKEDKNFSDLYYVNQIGSYKAYDAIVDGVAAKFLVIDNDLTDTGYISGDTDSALAANTLYKANAQYVGLYVDGTTPVYIAPKSGVGSTLTAVDSFQFSVGANEVLWWKWDDTNETMTVHKHFDTTEDFFAVVYDGKTATVFNDEATLNNYFESLACKKHNKVACDTCSCFEVTAGWMDTVSDGTAVGGEDLAALYLVLKKA